MAHQLGSNSATLMERSFTRRVAGAAARRLRLFFGPPSFGASRWCSAC